MPRIHHPLALVLAGLVLTASLAGCGTSRRPSPYTGPPPASEYTPPIPAGAGNWSGYPSADERARNDQQGRDWARQQREDRERASDQSRREDSLRREFDQKLRDSEYRQERRQACEQRQSAAGGIWPTCP